MLWVGWVYCPFCRNKKTKVIDKRTRKDGLINRRRRLCLACNNRFTTYEKIIPNQIIVIKKDDRKEIFDRQKIFAGMMKACKKGHVNEAVINEAVNRIESGILLSGNPEISSSELGVRVLEELKKIDNVAYLRFASVYKDFRNLTKFEEELEKLKSGGEIT
jgi:transcriptional repressor NrdR